MDEMTDKVSLWELLKKYRYVLLALLLGILILSLPDAPKESEPEVSAIQPQEETLEKALEQILEQIHGVGRVEVLLTQSAGERITYQTDEDISGTNTRRDTVLITGSDRNETGLIRQVLPPVYQGAVIVCQGGDNVQIRLAVVEAVMSATGLSSDRISVLKMK